MRKGSKNRYRPYYEDRVLVLVMSPFEAFAPEVR